MTPAERTAYIVSCIREGAAMYPEDAEKFLAEHDVDVYRDSRPRVLREAADVAVTIARSEGSGGSEMDQRAASAAARVGAELRRLATEAGDPR